MLLAALHELYLSIEAKLRYYQVSNVLLSND
jgi:hypothetical protein